MHSTRFKLGGMRLTIPKLSGQQVLLIVFAVLLVVLLVFGAKRLPEIGRSLGSGMREFKDSISGESKSPALPQTTQQQQPAHQPHGAVADRPVLQDLVDATARAFQAGQNHRKAGWARKLLHVNDGKKGQSFARAR